MSTSGDESLHLHGDEDADEEEKSRSCLSNFSSDDDCDRNSEADNKHQHRGHGGFVHEWKWSDGGCDYDSINDPSVDSMTPLSYGYCSDNVYHMENSAPAMKTVVHEPPVKPDYGYLDSYWNYPAEYSLSYEYFPVRMKNSGEGFKASPKKEVSPTALAWDFLNPFVVFDNGYAGYDPVGMYGSRSNYTSPDLSEVRKREGIPDLEEETENEVCKEDLNAKKSSRERNIGSHEQSGLRSKPVSCREQSEKPLTPLQYKEESQNRSVRDLREVVAEIRDDFEIASGYGKEVASMLEVEKLPYRPGFVRAPMKLAESYFEDAGKDVNPTVCNLSSTLDKLCAWEKRLYKEVKDEERLRVKYEKQCKRLRTLDEAGGEPGKIYAAQTCIRRLRTKLDVSMKAIDIISSRIHEVKDEELQPKVAALIHGLIRIWKAMLKFHQNQFQAITETNKTRKHRLKTGPQTDPSSAAVLELEKELLSWCHHFENWIASQKSHVESLNSWLLKCLHYETDESTRKPILYSPSQLGTPPIFVICNDWNNALKSMNGFDTSSLGGGLVQIFSAMENFTSEASTAHEHVRLQHPRPGS